MTWALQPIPRPAHPTGRPTRAERVPGCLSGAGGGIGGDRAEHSALHAMATKEAQCIGRQRVTWARSPQPVGQPRDQHGQVRLRRGFCLQARRGSLIVETKMLSRLGIRRGGESAMPASPDTTGRRPFAGQEQGVVVALKSLMSGVLAHRAAIAIRSQLRTRQLQICNGLVVVLRCRPGVCGVPVAHGRLDRRCVHVRKGPAAAHASGRTAPPHPHAGRRLETQPCGGLRQS